MKRFFFIFMIVFLKLQINAQTTFEGFIAYKNELLSPNTQVISDSLYQEKIKPSFGGVPYFVQKYYYKGKYYKSVMTINGANILQVYNPNDLKLYWWSEKSEDATYVLSDEKNDEIKEIKKLDDEETVLGEKCKKLTIIGTNSITTYWYSPNKYKVNYEDYKTHNYSNWNEYLKLTGSLPLKYDVRTKTLHILSTGIEVKSEKIEDSFFDLPKFKNVTLSKLY